MGRHRQDALWDTVQICRRARKNGEDRQMFVPGFKVNCFYFYFFIFGALLVMRQSARKLCRMWAHRVVKQADCMSANCKLQMQTNNEQAEQYACGKYRINKAQTVKNKLGSSWSGLEQKIGEGKKKIRRGKEN